MNGLYEKGKFKYSAFVAVSITLGLRYSDTSRITWSEIMDLEAGQEFSIIEQKTGKEAKRPIFQSLIDYVSRCYYSLGYKASRLLR